MTGWYMILSLIFLLGLIFTQVAGPIATEKSLQWAVPLGSPAAVEPVLAGDLVIVAGNDRTLVALNSTSGAVQWSVSLMEKVNDSMVVAGDKLLLPGANGTLTALSVETGGIVETLSLGATALIEPLVIGNTIVVSDTHGTVSIVDAETFTFRDSLVIPEGVSRAEAVGNQAMFADDDGTVTAIDVESVAVRWRAITNGQVSMMRATDDGDILLGLDSGEIVLLSGSNGGVLWQQIYTEAGVTDVTFTDNAVFAISGEGDVFAIDLANGGQLWQDALPAAGWFATDRCETSCPVITSDGTVMKLSTTGLATAPDIIITGGIEIAPIANENVLVVVTSRGDVLTFQIGKK